MADHTFDEHVRKETVINVVINVVINCTIIWFLKKDAGTIFAPGEHGFKVDIFATAFLLFFLMSLVVMSIHRAQRKSGKLPAFFPSEQNWRHRLLGRLPYSVWILALGFGLFAMIVFAPITVGLLAVAGVTEFTPGGYTLFKGIWVAIIVALMIRTIIEAALVKPAPLK
ncbi:MAG: hypothetical protein COA47_03275 [Robiginitomaculum sp.]|nr:MAG: hypothetical protein COA47_03275 [Robiginitomaculum sp.]